MAAVNFPRDAQGRIILESEMPAALPSPTAEPARPVRATEPGRRVPMTEMLPKPPPAEAPPAPTRPPAPRWPAAAGAVCGLSAVVVLVFLLQSTPVTPARSQPTALPTAAPSPSALPAPRQVVAFAAPGGDALGPIPANVAPIARYGDAWVQVPHDGGAVWVRAQDVPGTDLASLPDLEPSPTTMPPTAAPAPIVAQPPPTMEPEVCVYTDYGSRCGPASEMADGERIAATIATESKAWSESWLATATAEAQP